MFITFENHDGHIGKTRRQAALLLLFMDAILKVVVPSAAASSVPAAASTRRRIQQDTLEDPCAGATNVGTLNATARITRARAEYRSHPTYQRASCIYAGDDVSDRNVSQLYTVQASQDGILVATTITHQRGSRPGGTAFALSSANGGNNNNSCGYDVLREEVCPTYPQLDFETASSNRRLSTFAWRVSKEEVHDDALAIYFHTADAGDMEVEFSRITAGNRCRDIGVVGGSPFHSVRRQLKTGYATPVDTRLGNLYTNALIGNGGPSVVQWFPFQVVAHAQVFEIRINPGNDSVVMSFTNIPAFQLFQGSDCHDTSSLIPLDGFTHRKRLTEKMFPLPEGVENTTLWLAVSKSVMDELGPLYMGNYVSFLNNKCLDAKEGGTLQSLQDTLELEFPGGPHAGHFFHLPSCPEDENNDDDDWRELSELYRVVVNQTGTLRLSPQNDLMDPSVDEARFGVYDDGECGNMKKCLARLSQSQSIRSKGGPLELFLNVTAGQVLYIAVFESWNPSSSYVGNLLIWRSDTGRNTILVEYRVEDETEQDETQSSCSSSITLSIRGMLVVEVLFPLITAATWFIIT
eukprot:scaffold34936_cov176-Amphora_coffeaeformis.AAC.2